MCSHFYSISENYSFLQNVYLHKISYTLKSGELSADFIDTSEETITNLALKECSLRLNKPGDVLLAMYGATIGKSAILKIAATTNQAVCACTPNTGIWNEYLLVLLKAMKSNFVGQGAGGAQPNISREKIIATVTVLPPTKEQHRIVAKVDELMALCDQLENQHNNAAEAHEKLVAYLLGTLTQSQNAEDFNANWQRIAEHFDTLFTTETSIDELKQTLLQLAVRGKLTGSIPKREFVEVQELFDLIDGDRGSNYPKSHDYMDKGFCLFLSTKNVRKNGFLFDEIQFLSEEKHKTLRQGLMKRGDIVITTRGTLGNIAIYDDSVIYDCVRINSGMLILRPKSLDIIASFIMVFIQSPLFDNQLQEKRSGSAQPQIPAGILKLFTLPLFSIEEQQRIVIKVHELMEICDQLKTRINEANELQRKIADVLIVQTVN